MSKAEPTVSANGANSVAVIALEPIDKTGRGLRDALFDEINLLRAGKVSTQHARALANLVRQVLDAARLDLQYRLAVDKGETLQLGSAAE